MSNMVLAYMDARSLPGRDRAAAFVWNQSMFETLLVRARHSNPRPAAVSTAPVRTSAMYRFT